MVISNNKNNSTAYPFCDLIHHKSGSHYLEDIAKALNLTGLIFAWKVFESDPVLMYEKCFINKVWLIDWKKVTCSLFLSPPSAWRRRHVHLCGLQCRRLGATGHPPVNQHETSLQGAAGRRDPEQRSESGPVLPRPGDATARHLLGCQQQPLHRCVCV